MTVTRESFDYLALLLFAIEFLRAFRQFLGSNARIEPRRCLRGPLGPRRLSRFMIG